MRRWDIYWADVPYEENPGISKKRPGHVKGRA